ncbi:hypothetical protein CRUP_013551 [Coryphaenoides rupestris]|nr:hypothetical protein CRUP_013551 [Coryphaenoides rupestris]
MVTEVLSGNIHLEYGTVRHLYHVRVKRSVPNWAMSSSDFFGWVEELRRHAGYEKMDELARTFWAHFPSADRLGYGTHEPDE